MEAPYKLRLTVKPAVDRMTKRGVAAFSEADIGIEAQHFDGADDCNADLPARAEPVNQKETEARWN